MVAQGNLSSVYVAERTDGSDVALKWQLEMSEHEKTILKILKGKKFEHIIEVLAFEEKQDGIFTLMELGDTQEVENLPDKRKTCLQMAKGVCQLHSIGYFHRNIKPNKFVIGKDNKIKLIGFGSAKQLAEDLQTMQVGTFAYMAPEVLASNNYDYSVDTWSLGITYYQLFTNNLFFENENCYPQMIKLMISIRQQQINFRLQKQEKLQAWQKELLQKMIIQRLHGDKIDYSIKRVSIFEVVNDLEKQLNF